VIVIPLCIILLCMEEALLQVFAYKVVINALKVASEKSVFCLCKS